MNTKLLTHAQDLPIQLPRKVPANLSSCFVALGSQAAGLVALVPLISLVLAALFVLLCISAARFLSDSYLPAALAYAQLQALLAGLPAGVRRPSTPAAAAQLMAALARLEAEPLPEANLPAHHSLESLRLEDPAAMSGCWNPGCAAALVLAGILNNSIHMLALEQTCACLMV